MTLSHPEPLSKTHSEQVLSAFLNYLEKHGGKVTFADYMRFVLYEPGLGYYNTGSYKIGAKGDFITAPEMSSLFGYCIARYCEPVLRDLTNGTILEFGAGSGRLACDILTALDEWHCPIENYYILEPSPDLQARQRKTLSSYPQLLERVHWLYEWPATIHGIVIANEVIDAFPVHRLQFHKDYCEEFYVCAQDGILNWQLEALSTPALALAATDLRSRYLEHDINPYPYITELNQVIKPWLNTLNEHFKEGIILCIDYGFLGHEYYHPQRNQGTLMCHYQHHAHDNPLILPGIQDITAHVDFSLLIEEGKLLGLNLMEFTSQARFLLNNDLLAFLASSKSSLQDTAAVKRLTLPQEMGELFKVIAFSR